MATKDLILDHFHRGRYFCRVNLERLGLGLALTFSGPSSHFSSLPLCPLSGERLGLGHGQGQGKGEFIMGDWISGVKKGGEMRQENLK